MHDPLAITDADAEALAGLAQTQLRLAERFAARAEAEEDPDVACRLARACDRAARGFRQSLLLKSRLRRERDAAQREAGTDTPARSPEQRVRVAKRQRELLERLQPLICEQFEDRDADLTLALLEEELDRMMAEDDFANADIDAQLDHLVEFVGVDLFEDEPAEAPAQAAAETSPAPDSS